MRLKERLGRLGWLEDRICEVKEKVGMVGRQDL